MDRTRSQSNMNWLLSGIQFLAKSAIEFVFALLVGAVEFIFAAIAWVVGSIINAIIDLFVYLVESIIGLIVGILTFIFDAIVSTVGFILEILLGLLIIVAIASLVAMLSPILFPLATRLPSASCKIALFIKSKLSSVESTAVSEPHTQ